MRKQGWMQALQSELDRHRALPAAYGVSDCFILPMDAVLAITGHDPWPEERRYETELGAARRLRKHGFADVGDAFAAKLEEIPPAMMTRGDIGTVDCNGEVCGVVCIGSNVIGKSKTGWAVLPRSAATRAFKVT